MLNRQPPDAKTCQRWLQQLAILLQAGIALHPALSLLMLQQPPRQRQHWQPVLSAIEQGLPLSQALLASRSFAAADIALLDMAEHTGQLDLQLHRLAELQARRLRMRSQIRRTLRYPLTVLAGALAVTAFLLVEVVPGFADLYAGLGAELPWLTARVLAISDAVARHGLHVLLLALAALLPAGLCWQRSPSLRRLGTSLLWHCPILGSIVRTGWLGQWHRTLAESLQAGLPFLRALELAAGLVAGTPLEAVQQRLQTAVAAGRRLSEGLQDEVGYPPLCRQMIAIGEESGMLVKLLLELSRQFESELDNRCEQVLELLEPTLMAGLGVLVGTLVMALYMPLFQLGQVL